MKKLLLAFVLTFVLVSPAFAYYSYDGTITCIPSGVEDYERRFKADFKACKGELEQIQKSYRFYKKQYDKCQKKNRYEDWCREYGQKYEEYRSMLK